MTMSAAACAALLLPTAIAGPAFAQTALAVEEPGDGDIVVTGARLQAVREVKAKRAIPVIADTISSDEIGTLPDFGLGEALTRVPGVATIQNNARGEAQYLSIRGLSADYNLVQIDGVTLPANETGRRTVSLDVIPSSLASWVEVYKTVTAAMNANAIGGTANLRTRSAFDGGGRTFVGGRFDVGTWDFERTRGHANPSGQAEAIVSTTFGPDRTFGVVVSGSFFRRDSASLNSASDNYLYFDPATGNRLVSPTNNVSNAFVAPDRRRWLHYDNVRERYGVFGKFEFDDHDRFRAALTLADFRHTNDEERQSNLVAANTATANNRYSSYSNVTGTGGTVSSANAQVDLVNYDQTRRMRYADLAGTLTPNDRVKADLGVNFAVATYRQDARLATYRIANTTNLAYRYDIAPGSFTHFTFANPAFITAAANYRQFEYGTNSDDQREQALTARANIAVGMEDEGLGVAAGAYARFLDRRYDYQVDNYRNTNASTLMLSGALAPETYAPYNGGGQKMLLVEPAVARAVFDASGASFAANSTNAGGSLQSDYALTEDIYAAYAMARFARGPVRLTGGVRYEETALSTGSNSLRGTAYIYGQQHQAYRDWLPSAQADWDVTSALRVRAAYATTIGRPNYDDLAAREVVNVNSSTGSVSITGGNPGLRPRRSDNLDLSVEYYVNRDTLFSAALFQKRIADEILVVRNQASEVFDGVQQLVTRIRPVNASRPLVRGLELNAVVARMPFLPGPLADLGVSANLTLLDPTPPSVTLSDNVTQRRLSGLFESANVVANAKLFYTLGPITVQGAWNHLSSILYSVSTTDPLGDRRYAPSDLFDAQLRVKLSRHWTIVAQGKNLTDYRPQRLFGPDFRLLREEIDNGRAFYIGALIRY
ncbi:TonB-dependent receptor [Sphingomonas sp. 8AM]|uniref:TonB-dependent receptor n=1 Tax=Sphingomonas sp. 8AM TaxID=2653170 RepID=UPI0012F0D486|nr:TonB-dependent receptor [Sphingomonas sp. 8AM]VXC90474.1 TonB-dependent receptor [Sphingomonas sp. 8AM]